MPEGASAFLPQNQVFTGRQASTFSQNASAILIMRDNACAQAYRKWFVNLFFSQTPLHSGR